jgi:L-threonylcarbamoyladenylate synthase
VIPIAADEQAIAHAAQILSDGGLVAMPTETVYGLAADATNAHAVAGIFAVKGRPRFNPLIAHVRDLGEARAHAHLPDAGIRLAERFWPGPLTIVAPRRSESRIAELACAGLSTVAVRAPSHPVAQALLGAFGGPLAAPSANRSGRISPTTAQHVADDLDDDVDLILDGGPCAVGIESTIVGFDAEGRTRLLRPGGVPNPEIEAITGPLQPAKAGAVEAPGMLGSHYAPRARLRLDADAPNPDEAYLGFGAREHGPWNLSRSGDLIEAAANLYSCLRAIDATGTAAIAVACIPRAGLGEAIRDRLARAAAPRGGKVLSQG